METMLLSEVSANLPEAPRRRHRLWVWLLLLGLGSALVVTYLVLSGTVAGATGSCGGG